MNQPPDNSIPLLTEIIATPPAAEAFQPDYRQHAQPHLQATYPPAAEVVIPAAAMSAPVPNTEQLQQIRQEIEENLMQQLLGQVDTVLHQHLQDHLAVVLDNMADILKTRVRASLEQALAETVTQALAEEMAKFDNSKY